MFGFENTDYLHQIVKLRNIYIRAVQIFAIYDAMTLHLIFDFVIAEILLAIVVDAVKVLRAIIVKKLFGLTVIGIAVMTAFVSIIQIK